MRRTARVPHRRTPAEGPSREKGTPVVYQMGDVVARLGGGSMRSTLATRFWSKVERTESCWLWIGSRNPSGYGILSIRSAPGRRTCVGAHRVAWELLVGPIAKGLEIDHLCRVRHCVNPAHLEPVTRQENMRRGERATRSHCIRGHALSGANLYVSPGGQRGCRTCRRSAYRAWYRKMSLAVAA